MRIVITALLINLLIIPTTISGSFESSERKKYIASGFGQVYAPMAVLGAVGALEVFLAKKATKFAKNNPEAFKTYMDAKKLFFERLRKVRIGKFQTGESIIQTGRRLTAKPARSMFIGYTVWPIGTRASFIGFPKAANIPGLLAWTMTQLFTQENKFIPKKIQQVFGLNETVWKTLIPDKLPSFDFNLKENAKISAYVYKDKIRVKESMYSSQNAFIVGKPIYSADGLSVEIVLDRHKLKLFPEESDRITISLNPSSTSKARKLNLSDFSIKSGSHLWSGSKKGSKAAAMIWDIGVNLEGREPLYNKLRPLTSFIFEEGGRGYVVPIHHMMKKLTSVMVGTAAAWPMMEVGRQWATSGMLNFGVHALTSYDILFSFMLAGMTGKATGSRIIDLTALGGAKLSNALMNKFPVLKKRFPPKKNRGQLNSCTDFMSYILKPPLRGRTDLTMDVVRSVLWNRYGAVYNHGSLVLSGLTCGIFTGSSMYKNGRNRLLELFEPLEEPDPTAPYDLSGFPPQGASDHTINPSLEIDNEMTALDMLKGIAKVVTPSFGMSSHATAVNAERVFNEENGIEENQLSLNQETMGELYDMQANSVTSTMAEYEKNPEAFDNLLWIMYLMKQPIEEIQKAYLQRVDTAMSSNEPVIELKKVLYEFLEDFNQGQHKRSVYRAFEKEFKESGSIHMTSFMGEKIGSFIALSDVLIFATQYAEAAKDAPDILGVE